MSDARPRPLSRPALLRGLRLKGLFAAALLVLAACSSPGADLPPLPEGTRTEYRLDTGDQLRLTVFGDPRLSGEYRVNDSGNIAVPLAGSVKAVGLTSNELERSVAETLRRGGIVRQPDVAVEITSYRPVFVLGEVRSPGQFPYQPGMTVLSAVALAGGFNYRAVQNRVSVTRLDADGRSREYRADRAAMLQPGDVVTVFERYF
jgi:polysaccharide export outer membrane protein